MPAAQPEDWMKMAQEALHAAGACLRAGSHRSTVSRAYFAMYAAVTGGLIQIGERPRKVEGTWTHEKLPVTAYAAFEDQLGRNLSRNIRRRLRATYNKRLAADYMPLMTTDEETARRALTDAIAVARVLEKL